ncbi:MAG: PAS domain-containing protein [Phaeospirillum sp.]|nr:PAS domain-containing protein [Phaeospirillum sp.]
MVSLHLSGTERTVRDDEIIVSKTDTKGRITYCNDTFMSLSGYKESELIGQPHSIIRHPAMPRCAFKLVWDTIESGKEVFAYVINRSKNGDHYWVFAHVTPDLDDSGKIVGYHSFRRSVSRQAVAAVEPLYATLLAEEARHSDSKVGMNAAFQMLVSLLDDKGVSYDQFILGL